MQPWISRLKNLCSYSDIFSTFFVFIKCTLICQQDLKYLIQCCDLTAILNITTLYLEVSFMKILWSLWRGLQAENNFLVSLTLNHQIFILSWWCHGRCHRMANVWGRWTLVDPGRDSELKSSHGEDPGKTEISQEQGIRTKCKGEDLTNTNKCTKAPSAPTIYPGSGPSWGGNTPTPAFLLYILMIQELQLATRSAEGWSRKN